MSRRILVADDEKGIRGALGQLLEYEGYEVRTAANAVDAIAGVMVGAAVGWRLRERRMTQRRNDAVTQ